jgi:hypothetical protein
MTDEIGVDHFQRRDAIGSTARAQALEPRDFIFMRHDEQLSASAMWHLVLLAERIQTRPPFDAQPGFE